MNSKRAVVIGGGPAGLFAAEQLSARGHTVDLYDAMPSVARKFLLAGIGGMNITHSESMDKFISRYGDAADWFSPMLNSFGPAELIDWIHGLGVETIVGSSGRVFPAEMKAAPLLRRWKAKLVEQGVRFHPRSRWLGWSEQKSAAGNNCILIESEGEISYVQFDALILALGGGSWKKLGSDGSWVDVLLEVGVNVKSLAASNVGFEVDWSDYLKERISGQPLKKVGLYMEDPSVKIISEVMLTEYGIEGTGVYAANKIIRENWDNGATLLIDFLPEHSRDAIADKLTFASKKESMANKLRKLLRLNATVISLLNEGVKLSELNPLQLADRIKGYPIRLNNPRPMDEAISTIGGVDRETLSNDLMVISKPGIFVAGEMIDWDAPTGGYLLTGCFTTGYRAGQAAADYLDGL